MNHPTPLTLDNMRRHGPNLPHGYMWARIDAGIALFRNKSRAGLIMRDGSQFFAIASKSDRATGQHFDSLSDAAFALLDWVAG